MKYLPQYANSIPYLSTDINIYFAQKYTDIFRYYANGHILISVVYLSLSEGNSTGEGRRNDMDDHTRAGMDRSDTAKVRNT